MTHTFFIKISEFINDFYEQNAESAVMPIRLVDGVEMQIKLTKNANDFMIPLPKLEIVNDGET
jgi:hypothetical protein